MAPATPPAPGIYVPVPTFFHPRASPLYNAAASPVDIDTQAAHAIYLAKNGITGLVVLGSTGEAVHLSLAERSAVLSGVRSALTAAGFPDYPLIAGTAAQCVEEVVAQLEAAKQDGCQYGLVLTPGYNAPSVTQEGVVAWFTAVADRSPLPILVYHYPGVSNNVKVTPATHATLSRHPNIVGCKLSHGDVSTHAQVASNPAIPASSYAVFTGLGQQLFPVMAVGAAGAIDGLAGFFPKTMVRLHKLASIVSPTTEQEARERRLLQFRVSSFGEYLGAYGIIGIKESIARLRGFGEIGGARPPLVGGVPGGDAEWARWKEQVDALEEIEKSL